MKNIERYNQNNQLITKDMCMDETDVLTNDSLIHEKYHENLKILFKKKFADYRNSKHV